MREFIGAIKIEPLAMGILQIAPSFGFEALRYSDLTYIKILVGFFSEHFTMSPLWRFVYIAGHVTLHAKLDAQKVNSKKLCAE